MKQIANSLSKQLMIDESILASWLEIPPNSEMGDLALPCFRLAKELHKSPQVIAADIADALVENELVESAVPAGPYVNFRLNRATAMEQVMRQIRDDDAFYHGAQGAGQVVAIDLSSPNIAKPFSMGHLRSTVIGTAIANLLESDSYQTLRINHLGDWGTQFGKIIVAYHRYGDEAKIKANPIQELNALYVQFHEAAQDDPSLDDEARAAFKRMEDGNEDDLRLWRWMIEVSLEEFAKTYAMLGTSFTHNLGESFYNDKMDAVVKEIQSLGLLVESDGAEVVMLEDVGLPPCLIKRSDGATLYATRDLAAALYRHKDLCADRLLYVVGGEQRLHFEQVFAVLTRMGYDFAKNCKHIAFGMMRLGGKKMSTRKGQVVRLQEVLEEAVGRAKEIINEKNPSLQNADLVAKEIGVGAVIFNDLKTNRLHDIDFSMETALAFEGETGPYVQYTHARSCSVLRKAYLLDAGVSPEQLVTHSQAIAQVDSQTVSLDDPTWELIKQLSLFPGLRNRAIDEYDPSLIAKHVLDICQAFNHFYHDCPILTADEPIRSIRLALTDAARLTIRNSLQLLGIGYPAEI